MNILSLPVLESLQVDKIARESPARAGTDPLSEARLREEFQAVLFAMTLCGAVLNRDTIQFAQAVTELLQWSA